MMNKKIGILTFHNAYNYGAFLQTYALQAALEEVDCDVEIINYQNRKFLKNYVYAYNFKKAVSNVDRLKVVYRYLRNQYTFKMLCTKSNKFEKTICEKLNITKKIYSASEINEHIYDFLIAGSDQVWNFHIIEEDYIYLLDFVKDSSKKLSYAASFGRTEFSDYHYQIMKKYLQDFNKITVREKTGKKLLEEKCDINSEEVLDPTLLLRKNSWIQFTNNQKRILKDKYILIYLVGPYTYLYDVAVDYAKKNNLTVIALGDIQKSYVYKKVKINTMIDADPIEFINYFLNAEVVFTTSYHGTIFSINFNKEFYFELSKEKTNNNSRIVDIVEKFEIYNHEITSNKLNVNTIDWCKIEKKIEDERMKSLQKLYEMITIEVNNY